VKLIVQFVIMGKAIQPACFIVALTWTIR